MKYFVIGLKRRETVGLPLMLLSLSNPRITARKFNETGVLTGRQTTTPDRRRSREPLMVILGVSCVESVGHRQLTELVGHEYFCFLLLNETAKTIARANGIALPQVLLEVDSEGIPSDATVLLRHPYP